MRISDWSSDVCSSDLHGVAPESREWLITNILTPAGQIFIRLIKMIVVPIVISSLIVGIAGVGDAKKLGRIGLKTIIYFEIITTVAIIVGMLLADTVQPGAGIDLQQLTPSDISQYQKTTADVQHGPQRTVSKARKTGGK